MLNDFAFGIMCGAGGMFVAMVALILFVNHGTGRDWDDGQ